jgi:hypothetical protein
LALIASAILFAPLASWLALQRARSWALWFLFGVALGPVASLLLVLAPPGVCPACGTRSVGWPRSCTNCKLVFGTRLSGAARQAGPDRAATGAADTAGTVTVASAVAVPAATPIAAPVATPVSAATARSTRRATRATPAEPALPGPESTRRSATALGRRATLEPPAAPPAVATPAERATAPAPQRAPAGTLAILGSGVFIGGSEALQIGSRYLLARVGAELHVLGPVHISPAAVATRIPLAGVEPTLLADRLLITSNRPGRGSDLAFGGVSLESGVDVARELRAPRKGRSANT